ncbi:MAG TPA: hypothetical protein VH442_02825 [Micromonosporaceae bacterium]|jgi:hypothetical protein
MSIVTQSVDVHVPLSTAISGAPDRLPYQPGMCSGIGLSGYYGTGGLENCRTFNSIFSKTLDQITAITSKPIVVTETGGTDSAGRKAEWIRQMFQELPAHPNIIGVIWFEAVKELDWRVAASPAAAAYRQGAEDARYQVTWSANSDARLGSVNG